MTTQIIQRLDMFLIRQSTQQVQFPSTVIQRKLRNNVKNEPKGKELPPPPLLLMLPKRRKAKHGRNYDLYLSDSCAFLIIMQ